MTPPLRVLIDLNIILDALQQRQPFFKDSAQLLSLAESGIVDGVIAAHSVTTLYYLYTRFHSSDGARSHLTQLLQFLHVAAVDQEVIEGALALPYKDFEDAVQMMAALRAGAAYVVTRNIADFRAGPLPALPPVELLKLL